MFALGGNRYKMFGLIAGRIHDPWKDGLTTQSLRAGFLKGGGNVTAPALASVHMTSLA